MLTELRREHPHLKLIVIEDALASNGPHIKLLRELQMGFILGAKPKDHTFLFDWVANSSTQWLEQQDDDGTRHRFQFINAVPLNDANFDCEVNFLAYWETSPKGSEKYFSWITDIPLSEDNVQTVMRGGRARWRIENETFNTLKNQGYHFEHNFGHGDQHLSTVFAYLMVLAFLLDQIQGLCCQLFKQAVSAIRSRRFF
ncbi:MAG: hypothetical protein QF414_06730 [Arenicellales bacterium]|nr:hypothetical protein [Arenicellales bacterium]